MYIIVEYLIYVIIVTLLGATLFATTTLVLIGQEGAKYITHNYRKVAERTLQAAAATAKTVTAVVTPSGHNPAS